MKAGAPHRTQHRRSEGIVLAVVLVLIFVLITAVYAFQRRAIINTTIAQNRLAAGEADALARGGLRIAEAVVYVLRMKQQAGGQGDPADGDNPASGLLPSAIPMSDLWARMGEFPLEFDGGQSLRIDIEDVGAKLNLNALVPQSSGAEEEERDESITSTEDHEDAELYLVEVLRYIIDGMPGRPEEKIYDPEAIARNLIDYMDADETAIDGRNEDAYYRDQDPPYTARNGPFLTVDEIGLVEGVDPPLLAALRNYLTVYPIGGSDGINLNRAEPWVLSLVYSGPSDQRELIREATVRDLWAVRKKDKILCEGNAGDADRCIDLNEVANGHFREGSIYPPAPLPAQPSVFRVIAEARVGNLTRRFEAIYDTRSLQGPQLLSWRRLRGTD